MGFEWAKGEGFRIAGRGEGEKGSSKFLNLREDMCCFDSSFELRTYKFYVFFDKQRCSDKCFQSRMGEVKSLNSVDLAKEKIHRHHNQLVNNDNMSNYLCD